MTESSPVVAPSIVSLEYMTDVEFPALHNIFSMPQIRSRSQYYTDKIYVESFANRKVRKAFKNQLVDLLAAESNFIKKQLRIFHQRKQRKTKPLIRAPTAYTKFCKEIKEKYPHNEVVGKIQGMWKLHNKQQIKERKVEKYESKESINTAIPIPEIVCKEEEPDIVFNALTENAYHNEDELKIISKFRYESESDSDEDS